MKLPRRNSLILVVAVMAAFASTAVFWSCDNTFHVFDDIQTEVRQVGTDIFKNATVKALGDDGLLVYADCVVVPCPTAEELAQIDHDYPECNPGVCMLLSTASLASLHSIENTLFSVKEGDFANSVSRNLNDMFHSAAEELREEEGVQVFFSDPINDFRGHDVCAETPGIHGAILGDLPFVNDISGKTPAEKAVLIEGGLPVSQQSYHPNLLGAQLYARSLNDTLQVMGL